MGRGIVHSRSKSRMTALEKRDDNKKRSLSKLKEKIDRDDVNWEESDDEYSDEPFEVEQESIQYENVAERYKIASNFVQATLEVLISEMVPGASTKDLCKMGDEKIETFCGTVFNKKTEDGEPVFKGIAFPTNISCNDITCHYSPIEGENTDHILADGDIAKVHLACQIDGYVSQVAHTVIVGDATRSHLKSADVTAAAYAAMELTCRLMRPDLQNSNAAVTNMYSRVAEDFGVSNVQGVLSHRVLRWNQIGPATIISVKISDMDEQFQEVDEVMFGANEVWHVDVVMSSGHTQLHCAEEPTTIVRRNDIMLAPRIRAAHYVLASVREKFQMFPFSTRNFEDLPKAKLGINELKRLDMVDPMPVLKTKKQDVTARFSWTIMLTPNGIVRLTGLPLGENIKTSKSIQDPACQSIAKASLLAPSHPQRIRKAKNTAKRAKTSKEENAMDAD